MKRRADVVVGVAVSNCRVLVGRRKAQSAPSGYWLEFPGGHRQNQETEAQALTREWYEEVGSSIAINEELYRTELSNNLCIAFYSVQADVVNNEVQPTTITGPEGQDWCWLDLSTLQAQDFWPANATVIAMLQQA